MALDPWRGHSGSGGERPARSGSAVPLHLEADLRFQSETGEARVRADGRTVRLQVTGADPASLLPPGLRFLPFLRRVRTFLAQGDLELRVESGGRPLLRLDPALPAGFWGRLVGVPGLRVGVHGLRLWWRTRNRP